jgi:3-hydroxybutyryl-CoA dehydratase
MQVGDLSAWERTFTIEDVELFSRLSGDQGNHHITPDEQGRLLVHGLLTATIPTKLGGDINFIARELTFEFRRPVFTGDTIRCESTITQLEKREGHTYLETSWTCRNQYGKEVLSGHARGIVRDV